jgi:aerobic carbon-monoxide dehydrogenase large subunit
VFSIAANILECAPADLELRDGGVGIAGVPAATLSLSRIARAAMPSWSNERPPGVDAGLEETFYWQPPTVTWSYAVHVAIVEVDAETGRVRIDTYAVAHDCGNVINPMLVEGQIHGGAVQGLGGILYEAIAYDANGQLLSGSFMDYAMPIAADIPDFKIVHMHSPSPLNPLGVKGVGEGGAVAPPVAVANAVCDALAGLGLEINATPLRPAEIAKLVKAKVLP